jgi:phospholipid/cholesterol/gamma-HCH transport system substrate-binding protein
MGARRNIILGGFLLAALALLVVLSLVLTGGFRWGYQDWIVYFGPDSRVEEGYEVTTSGKKVGLVRAVELIDDPSQMAAGRYVKATISIPGGLTLWEGAGVHVVARGLLGGVGIDLQRGDPTKKPITPGQPLEGVMASSFFDELRGVVRDNRGNLVRTTDRIAELADRVAAGEGSLGKFLVQDEFYRTVQSVAARLDGLLADVQSNESSLGRLLRDKEVYDELLGTARDVREIAAGLRNGKGTIGRLLTDDRFAEELEKTLVSLRSVAQRLDKGEGTLGKLLTDDQVHKDLVAGVQALRRFTERIEKGQGTFTRLLDDDTVYENLRILSENVRLISEDVRAGKGSLGMLLQDEGLYRDARALLQSFRESGEIARENAPLSSLTSFTSLFFNVLN